MSLQGLVRGCLAAFFSLIISCATPVHQAIRDVELGMRQSQVLDLIGSPEHSYRHKGRDIWVYRYYKKDKEFGRKIHFQSNYVSAITDEKAYPQLAEEIENASSLKEYEQKAELYQKLKKEGEKKTKVPEKKKPSSSSKD